MDINFNNPDFDNYLQEIGFIRQDDNDSESTIFKSGDGMVIDLSRGLIPSTLSKIIATSIRVGALRQIKRATTLAD